MYQQINSIFNCTNRIGYLALLLLFWGVHNHCCFPAAGQNSEAYTFLIQDQWGVITGITLAPDFTPSEPEVVRGMLDSVNYLRFPDLQADSEGGYQLASNGSIVPLGKAALPFSIWTPVAEANCFVVSPDREGIWIAAGDFIKVRGRPPQVVFPPDLDQGIAIADLEFDPASEQLAILFENGLIANCSRNQYQMVELLHLENDAAVDLEFSNDAIYILTYQSKVFHIEAGQLTEITDIPDLGTGLAADLELSPTGRGFYLLDVFGVIHACQGAPDVPSTPFEQNSAVDLEIISLTQPPRWNPAGWSTEVFLQPGELKIDPAGPAKNLSLMVEQAESLASFVAELKYDPETITIVPEQVKVGQWWEKSIQGAEVLAAIDSKNGILSLYGSGSFLPFAGADGNGELAQFSISASTKALSSTTSIDLTTFVFKDAYPGDLPRTAAIVRSASVFIQTIHPQLTLAWGDIPENQNLLDNQRRVKPGEILRVDLLIENGSKVQGIEFDFTFTADALRFLGTGSGEVWREDSQLVTFFDIPHSINQNGGAEGQKIQALTSGACRDVRQSIVVLYFVVQKPLNGVIVLENLLAYDMNGVQLAVSAQNQKLSFMAE